MPQVFANNQLINDFDEDLDNKDFQKNDPRIRRLMSRKDIKQEDKDSDEEYEGRRGPKQRHIHQPQVLLIGSEVNDNNEDNRNRRRNRREMDDESSDEEVDDENVERRHAILRLKREEVEEELMEKDDDEDNDDNDESEYEEYTDSEDETGPRLKPVFVKQRDRVTIHEKEKEELKLTQEKDNERRLAEERRRQTLKIIEDDIRKEEAEKEELNEEEAIRKGIASVLTDDENEETAYEVWKLRELKRIKRDKDENEAALKAKLEIERLRNLTEEERLADLRNNPKIVTNAAPKGKYKFLQKYYHRGAFYLDEDDQVFKRDFAQPTLEDHFDRTVVPKVMQVKNFGRSGRTKYTHLVDQDTTAFDSPWTAESTQSNKFHSSQAGGMKQVFDRPSGKRK
jgi:microfibrillar-associated protein 1